jgi:DNA invertase Pin-like site-specific DNA recombinase
MILAAGYLRMSSDQQTTSIENQRKAVSEYAAKHGFKIVKWYIDEGISGWRNDRAAFQQLISDAPSGQFAAILVWDQDRFSRFDVLEANHYWFLLKQAGVYLVTATKGRVDWDSLAGWLTASIEQHGKAEYCRTLGQNVAVGQRARRLAGQWIGCAPLGYTLGDDGFLKIGAPADVATVRRIFALRLAGHGTKFIAVALNRDGIASPRGKQWSSQAVRHILQRDAYLGCVLIGKWARGKYARIVQGQQVVPGTHPRIIDDATWQGVREMQQERRTKKHNGDGEGSPLAGLLYCGDCGKQLYAQRFRTMGTAQYLCSTYHMAGGCHCNRVEQVPILQLVLAKVREAWGLSDMDRLRTEIGRQLAIKASIPGIDRKTIQRQVKAIDAKLSTAAERLMSVAPSLVASIEAKMLELQAERSRLAATLAEKPQAKRRPSIESVLAPLLDLDKILRGGKPSAIRAALSQRIAKVTIRFESWKQTADGRKWRRPCGGTITLLSNGELPSERTCTIGTRQIRLSRQELLLCVRQRPWNYRSTLAV